MSSTTTDRPPLDDIDDTEVRRFQDAWEGKPLALNIAQFNFQLLCARVKYVAWRLGCIVVLGTIYVSVIRDGLKYLVPPTAQKLSKIPLLSFFDEYEATHRLDLAFPLSIFVLAIVWWAWDHIMHRWLSDGECISEIDSSFNEQRFEAAYLIIGFTAIATDSGLFYVSMTQFTWGGRSFSISAIMATCAYLAILIFVSFVNVNLKTKIKRIREQLV